VSGVRTDPSDTGGLFVGRRPGTAPVKYQRPPQRAGEGRRRADSLLAHAILGLMIVINLLFWGPIPALALWVASQVQYLTGSITFGIFAGFLLLLALLFGGLAMLKRLDHAWVIVRRAAGVDQRGGVIGRVFAVTAVIGGAAFLFWLLFIGGLGSSVAPRQGG
jgi:hypothetical protein